MQVHGQTTIRTTISHLDKTTIRELTIDHSPMILESISIRHSSSNSKIAIM